MPTGEKLPKHGTIKSSEQASAMGKIGGVKSGEARRAKRQMQETLELLLQIPLTKPKKGRKGQAIDTEAIKNLQDVRNLDISVEQGILIAQIQRALKGDTSAFIAIRDTSGNKPKDEMSFDGHIPIVITGEEELED